MRDPKHSHPAPTLAAYKQVQVVLAAQRLELFKCKLPVCGHCGRCDLDGA